MQLERDSLTFLKEGLDRLEEGFADLPDIDVVGNGERMRSVMNEVAVRLQDNYPYQHPFYAGQMLKPPHPLAKAAYMLSMWINPNNHALDGGRASSQMEKEAVAALAGMVGWDDHLGHLTGGGTMANMEALWIGGRLHPGRRMIASDQAHYTHSRLCEVLGLQFRSVRCDPIGSMDIGSLENELKKGDVGTVVVTLGTTGTGSIDPLPEVLGLRERFDFRIHVDAAYGGYFILANNLGPRARAALDLMREADSIVIDPHKHGLQPYGCGCILFKDPEVGRFYKHDSPYTYFTSNELHLGEISLECSRAGASAVALWATQRLLPMVKGGKFANDLSRCREAAQTLYGRIADDERFMTVFPPELDIVVWAPGGSSASEISRRTELFFERAEGEGLHLAKFRMVSGQLRTIWKDVEFDQDHVTLIRSCLMKPEHLEWMDRIWKKMDGTMEAVLTNQK
jgi:tyrosine decarboxylase/aspartate 1-decarboxylase